MNVILSRSCNHRRSSILSHLPPVPIQMECTKSAFPFPVLHFRTQTLTLPPKLGRHHSSLTVGRHLHLPPSTDVADARGRSLLRLFVLKCGYSFFPVIDSNLRFC
ncbi:hypothetical protein LXL04_017536 [Taraxacum kok-saghyz]